jgi:16S rRNA C1402 (ribose-2'-O) methylase RsmI
VGRELTKSHEELVRGPISAVLSGLKRPLGEYTVVADIGHVTAEISAVRADRPDMLSEFYQLTKSGGLSRRAAISTLARRHGISSRAVYQSIEAAKSVEAVAKGTES